MKGAAMGLGSSLPRRSFLAGIGGVAAAAALPIGAPAQTSPAPAAAATSGPKLKLGLIGAGGRGGWIADLFRQDGGYELWAVADYFEDRAKTIGDKAGVPAARQFTGLSGYKRLLETKPDVVAIISPPYFHPEQARAAVDAGVHVYLAKPIAVDVAGCQAIEEAGKRATEKKLAFLVDFQTRNDPFYVEAVKRVHAGGIGKIAFGECSYQCDRLGAKGPVHDTPEGRLRNWVFDKTFSGDIITEQNIHTLDVTSWIMNSEPLHAFGTCGRKVRVDVGDCNDCFTLVFQYPGVGVTFNSRQFEGHGSKPDGILNRFFGDLGVIETSYGGNTMIRGKNFYRGGASPGIYKDGAVRNIAAFREAIRAGRFGNDTVAPSVRSNLVTILGRTAAYTGEVVTWEKLLKSGAKLEADLKTLKA